MVEIVESDGSLAHLPSKFRSGTLRVSKFGLPFRSGVCKIA